MDKLRAMVTGIHGYVPEYRLTNKELESLVDTNDEWIMSRTGIKERRILKGENQGTSVLGIEAVKGLLEKTGTDPMDVELIICATVTPDMPFPATANIIADSGYAFANTVNIKVDSTYAFANIVNIKVDSAYAFSNTVNITLGNHSCNL